MNAIDDTPGNSGRPQMRKRVAAAASPPDAPAGAAWVRPQAAELHHLRAEVGGAEASLLLP